MYLSCPCLIRAVLRIQRIVKTSHTDGAESEVSARIKPGQLRYASLLCSLLRFFLGRLAVHHGYTPHRCALIICSGQRGGPGASWSKHSFFYRYCPYNLTIQSVLWEPVPGTRGVQCSTIHVDPAENCGHMRTTGFAHGSERIDTMVHA